MATSHAALNGLPSILTHRPASAEQHSDASMAAEPLSTTDPCTNGFCDTSSLTVDVGMSFEPEEETHRRVDRIGEGFCSPDHKQPEASQPGRTARHGEAAQECTCAVASRWQSARQENTHERIYRLAAGFCAPQQARWHHLHLDNGQLASMEK